MNTLNPFPYIFKDTFDFEFEENKEKIDSLMMTSKMIIDQNNLKTPEIDDAATSVVMMGLCNDHGPFEPPTAWEEFEYFTTEWLPERVNYILKAWKLADVPLHISESWINVHGKGGWTNEHDHQLSTIAMGCYLNVPENSGRLLVKTPMQSYKYSEPLHPEYWDGMEWEPIEVKTNDVIFFPGWLRHKTEKNNSDEIRYVMSANMRPEILMRKSIRGMRNLPQRYTVDKS